MNNYFICGIGTDVGKTIVSAILVNKLSADYWKPIQAGDLENSDSIKIKNWLSNNKSKIWEERYKLKTAASPHIAAEHENISININHFELPKTNNNLIVEAAGGILVPINNEEYILNLAERLNLPIILVSRFYLGSINHTLLSINVLQNKGLNIKGIVFTDKYNPSTVQAIKNYANIAILGHIELPQNITKDYIKNQINNINI